MPIEHQRGGGQTQRMSEPFLRKLGLQERLDAMINRSAKLGEQSILLFQVGQKPFGQFDFRMSFFVEHQIAGRHLHVDVLAKLGSRLGRPIRFAIPRETSSWIADQPTVIQCRVLLRHGKKRSLVMVAERREPSCESQKNGA